jgi:hypothetical protein
VDGAERGGQYFRKRSFSCAAAAAVAQIAHSNSAPAHPARVTPAARRRSHRCSRDLGPHEEACHRALAAHRRAGQGHTRRLGKVKFSLASPVASAVS